jgi:hypothetical protein
MRAEIDPALLMAHAVHTTPGVYAVLLGSGASSSAGIPTGWAITLDLVRRLAHLEGEDADADPEAWYQKRFGQSPDYSYLLNRLGGTQAERQAIIRGYIDPTDEERQQGLKIPRNAHRALAHLASGGHVRIILTTNFDRLIEQAFIEAGVDFDVIAGVDALTGARPVGQAPTLVVKLHGDYRDARILNTESELAAYPKEIDALLDRILDEQGLIVSGWSATWDPALRSALLRQANRRYTTYWATRGDMTPEAAELANARGAVVLGGLDSDTVFTQLADRLDALNEMSRPHPLTTAMAIAELKLYLPDPTKRLRLRDLVTGQAEHLRQAISDSDFPVDAGLVDSEYLRERAARYEATSKTLIALMATGCAFADDPRPFADALEQVANPSSLWSGNTLLLSFRRYPALLNMYAGGIAAVHAGQWLVLCALLYDPLVVDVNGRLPAAAGLSPWVVVDDPRGGSWLPGMERHFAPVSDHLFATLREQLQPVISVDARYEDAFERFEFLYGLVIQDQSNERDGRIRFRAPIGRLGWKRWYAPDEALDPVVAIPAEAAAAGENWPPLAAGLFGGDTGRLKLALERYQAVVDYARGNWH